MNIFPSRWFAACLIPLLVSCGGGGGHSTAPTARVMRVEIEQTGLLMTASGETRVLSARVFDEQGLELPVAPTWSSTAPDAISVDTASGQVTARVANGSAQITASAQGRVSAPLLAVVTPLAAGVRPIADAEVLRAAASVDPLAEPDPDSAYTVILDTATPIAVGERLLSTGSQAVVGEVLAVEPVTPGQQVTLRLLPLSELLPALDLDLDLDLSEAPIELNPAIAERYTMLRDGGRVLLTPRPELGPATAGKTAAGRFAPATARSAAVARPAGTFAFDRGCELALDGGADDSLPITFDISPTFDIAINPSLDVQMENGGLQRVIVRAAPRIVLDAELRTTLAFQGKVECKAELFRIRLPIGGALSFVLGGLIPVGFGAELAGQVTVGNVTMGYRSTTTGSLAAGLTFTDAGPGVVSDVSISNRSEPRLTPPGDDFGDNLKFKPALFGFAFAEVVFGNPFLRRFQFNALVGKFGAKFEGDFASIDTQIADPAYASTYGIAVACELGPDSDLNRAVQLLFGSATFIPKKFECGFPPFTQLPRLSSATSNRQSWVDGDEVLIDVRFDPATLDFIPGIGPENLSTINLVRLDRNGRAAVVASATESSANPGAASLRFLAGETPNGVFRAGNVDELFVTYITSLLPLSSLRLEAGKVSGNRPPVANPDSASIDANSGRTPIPVLSNDIDPEGAALRIDSTTPASNGGVFVSPDGTTLEYQPNPGYLGDDSFDYTIRDEGGETATATVSINVINPTGRISFGGASVSANGGATACENELDETCRLSQPPNGAQFSESTRIASDLDSGGVGGSQSASGTASVEDGEQAASVTGNASASASPAGTVRTFTASCDASAEVTEEVVQADKADAQVGGSIFFRFDLPAGSSFSVATSGVSTTVSDPAYNSAATVQISFQSDADDGYFFEQSAAGIRSNNGAPSGMAEGEASFSVFCNTFPVNRLEAGQVRSRATATVTLTAPP